MLKKHIFAIIFSIYKPEKSKKNKKNIMCIKCLKMKPVLDLKKTPQKFN